MLVQSCALKMSMISDYDKYVTENPHHFLVMFSRNAKGLGEMKSFFRKELSSYMGKLPVGFMDIADFPEIKEANGLPDTLPRPIGFVRYNGVLSQYRGNIGGDVFKKRFIGLTRRKLQEINDLSAGKSFTRVKGSKLLLYIPLDVSEETYESFMDHLDIVTHVNDLAEFGIIRDADIAKKLRLRVGKKPSYFVYRPFERVQRVSARKPTNTQQYLQLTTDLTDCKVCEFEDDVNDHLMTSELFLYFADMQKSRKDVRTTLKQFVPSAKKNKIRIFSLGGKTYSDLAQRLKLKDVPALVAVRMTEPQGQFIYDGDYSSESLDEFIIKFRNNELVNKARSQPIVPPEEQKNNKIVVLDDWEQFFNQKTTRLLKIFAPWCGHCKAMAEDWNTLADRLAEEGSDVIVGEYDGDSNDMPAQFEGKIKGYPTVVKITADDEVKFYEGQRTLEAMYAWAKEE
ncbi:hypothetical protein PCE1_001800 [Barthelona sp. PCE]